VVGGRLNEIMKIKPKHILLLIILATVPAVFAERAFTNLTPAISGPSADNIGLNLDSYLAQSLAVNSPGLSAYDVTVSGLLYSATTAASTTPLAPSAPSLSFSSGVSYSSSVGSATLATYSYTAQVPAYASTYLATYSGSQNVSVPLASNFVGSMTTLDSGTLAMMNPLSAYILNVNTGNAAVTTNNILTANNFLNTGAGFAGTPEPQAIGLLSLGAGMLFWLHRRRKA